MTQESNVITIDGKEYKEADFNQEQAYTIRHIRNLQNKTESIKFELDQAQMALQFATTKLISSLTTSEVDDLPIAN